MVSASALSAVGHKKLSHSLSHFKVFLHCAEIFALHFIIRVYHLVGVEGGGGETVHKAALEFSAT